MSIQSITAPLTAKFLSEVINEIPSNCLLNKGITGCGGTTLEIQSERDSIILVPNVNLVLNKTEAHSNLIGVYGDITLPTFKKMFIKETPYKKIIATYDALPKLIDWIGEKIYDYFLLIDEYHILFNSYSFRYSAIKNVLSLYSKFKEYCFMTATPLNEDNILEEIKHLDVINIEWPQSVKVNTTIENVYQTNQKVAALINEALTKDYNLHIFINSINTIKAIIKKIETKDYRTICSKNAEKTDNKSSGILQVKSINSPVCKINFYTATAFEGVDIYDPIGKTIVISDTNIATSLVDISTLFIQICGRLRDSIYKDQVTFICNTSKHRYMSKTDQQFEAYSEDLTNTAISYEQDFVNRNQKVKEVDLGSFKNDPTYFQSKYIGENNDLLIYDPNLKKVDKQNFYIITKLFDNTLSVIKNLNDTGKINAEIKNVDPIFIEIYNVVSEFPLLELGWADINKYLDPVFNKYNLSDTRKISNLLDQCANKKRVTKNGSRVSVYNFTKLRAAICQKS